MQSAESTVKDSGRENSFSTDTMQLATSTLAKTFCWDNHLCTEHVLNAY